MGNEQPERKPKQLPDNMPAFLDRVHEMARKDFNMGDKMRVHAVLFKPMDDDDDDPHVICDRNGCRPVG